jgi:hypothetical protein
MHLWIVKIVNFGKPGTGTYFWTVLDSSRSLGTVILVSGLYWIRTSDPFHVKEVL